MDLLAHPCPKGRGFTARIIDGAFLGLKIGVGGYLGASSAS